MPFVSLFLFWHVIQSSQVPFNESQRFSSLTSDYHLRLWEANYVQKLDYCHCADHSGQDLSTLNSIHSRQ